MPSSIYIGLCDTPAIRIALLLVPLAVDVQRKHAEARNYHAKRQRESDHQLFTQRQAHDSHFPIP